MCAQLLFSPRALAQNRPKFEILGEQADFFMIGPENCVRSHTKTPRKSQLRVFQSPRWRPKWPPL